MEKYFFSLAHQINNKISIPRPEWMMNICNVMHFYTCSPYTFTNFCPLAIHIKNSYEKNLHSSCETMAWIKEKHSMPWHVYVGWSGISKAFKWVRRKIILDRISRGFLFVLNLILIVGHFFDLSNKLSLILEKIFQGCSKDSFSPFFVFDVFWVSESFK